MKENETTVADCKGDLEILTKIIDEQKKDKRGTMYNCPLKQNYIGSDAKIINCPDFLKAVVKIQNDQIHCLTESEKKRHCLCSKTKVQHSSKSKVRVRV